jgi:hypothetical protein
MGVGIAQSLQQRPGFDSRQGQAIFVYTTTSRPTLGSTLSPIQRVPGALSTEIRRSEREAEHSLPTSAEVKNGGAILPFPIGLHGVDIN